MASEEEIVIAAKGMAAVNLSGQLNAAMAYLNSALAASDASGTKITGNALLNHETLEVAFEEVFASMYDDFSDFSAILNGMKSSWMPIEILEAVEEIGGSTFTSESIPDRQSLMESFENTFLRMVGMPSSNDISDCTGCLFDIDDSGNMSVENTNFNTDIGRAFITSGLWGVLNKRQTAEKYRVRIGDLYNFLPQTGDPFADENPPITNTQREEMQLLVDKIRRAIDDGSQADITAVSTATGGLSTLQQGSSESDGFNAFRYATEEMFPDAVLWSNEGRQSRVYNKLAGVIRVPSTIDYLENPKNYYKHCHLLFPPFQDGDIATCINESSKIVADPFMPETQRKINNSTLRSTLLEAIIRIRLDKLSGTTAFNGSNSVDAVVGQNSEPLEFSDLVDSFGLLESLVLTRLWASVGGMAKYIRKKRPELKRNQYRTGYVLKDVAQARPVDGQAGDVVPNAITYSLSEEKDILNTAKLIEDSMMMFFGDNSVPAALALQEDTQRTVGMKNAHLMSTIISIVGVNRKAIDKRLGKIEELNRRSTAKVDDVTRSNVSSILGVHKGIGIIDVVAFSIALFSIKEGVLIGLLNDTQYANMKKEFTDNFFDEFDELSEVEGGRSSMINAVNDVTIHVNGVYQYFLSKIAPSGTAHAHPGVVQSGTQDAPVSGGRGDATHAVLVPDDDEG